MVLKCQKQCLTFSKFHKTLLVIKMPKFGICVHFQMLYESRRLYAYSFGNLASDYHGNGQIIVCILYYLILNNIRPPPPCNIFMYQPIFSDFMPLHIINPFTCWKSQNSPHISREPALFFHQFCQRARQDASDKKQKRKIKNTKMQFVQKNFLGNSQRKNIGHDLSSVLKIRTNSYVTTSEKFQI